MDVVTGFADGLTAVVGTVADGSICGEHLIAVAELLGVLVGDFQLGGLRSNSSINYLISAELLYFPYQNYPLTVFVTGDRRKTYYSDLPI